MRARRRGAGSAPSAAPLRVLVVEASLHPDGALAVTLDRARRWQASGASVGLFVIHRGVAARSAQAPVELPVTFATDTPQRWRRTVLPALWRGWRLARAADVVVAGREVGEGLLLAALLSRLARRPFAVTVQSRIDTALEHYVAGHLRGLHRWVLRSAALLVPVSRGVGDSLGALGARPERVQVVRNGIDVAAVRERALAPLEVELPTGRWIVGCGRLEVQKGFDLLIRAHAAALAGGAPAHSLLIIGAGGQQAALERLVRDLGVHDTVRLTGEAPRRNPHPILSRADLYVLSSRWEGLPLVLLEALALGVPIVSSDCVAGPTEVLEGGAHGRLYPVEDVDRLAALITEHLRDPGALRAAAQRGAMAVAERFDPAVAAAHHLRLLAALTGISSSVEAEDHRLASGTAAPSRVHPDKV